MFIFSPLLRSGLTWSVGQHGLAVRTREEGGRREEERREGGGVLNLEKTRTHAPYYCTLLRPAITLTGIVKPSHLLIIFMVLASVPVIFLNIFPAITCLSLCSRAERIDWLSDDLTVCYSQLKFTIKSPFKIYIWLQFNIEFSRLSIIHYIFWTPNTDVKEHFLDKSNIRKRIFISPENAASYRYFYWLCNHPFEDGIVSQAIEMKISRMNGIETLHNEEGNATEPLQDEKNPRQKIDQCIWRRLAEINNSTPYSSLYSDWGVIAIIMSTFSISDCSASSYSNTATPPQSGNIFIVFIWYKDF